MERVNIWDGWRGVAISFLLIGHFISFEWIREDRLGVDIFFVLSGMLMSKILFEKKLNLKDFYIRRFSRILPVLFLFILVVYAVETFAGHPYQIREIFANLLFIRTYYPSVPHIWDVQAPTGHLWSLNVEEHAYILMSVMTLILFRNKHVATCLITLGVISIAICFYKYFENTGDEFRIRTECAISFIFLSAGYNLVKNRLSIHVNAVVPIVTFLLAISCYLMTPVPEWLNFSLAPLLLAFTVNHLDDVSGVASTFLNSRYLRLLGLWSYSIYIWQQPFYEYSYTLPGGPIAGLILSIIVGAGSFYLYESPIRSWINNRYSKRHSAIS